MRAIALSFLILIAALAGCEHATPKQITVFAAASTTDVMGEAGRRFEAETGMKIAFSFDASSNLAKQIKAGAPADVFLSADEEWMDAAAASGDIRPDSREDLLGNELVLIAPTAHPFDAKMSKDFDFAASLPQIKRIAVGDPSHVPAGRYAKQSLDHLGWWAGLEHRLLPAQDVRAALRLVEINEADAGIVYATDAKSSDKVVVIAAFPGDSHEPIRYPIALCKSASPAATDFISFLRTPEIVQVFEKAGFRVLPAPPAAAPAAPAHGSP